VLIPGDERAEAEEKLLAVLDEHEIDFLVDGAVHENSFTERLLALKKRLINVQSVCCRVFQARKDSGRLRAWREIAGVTAHFVACILDEGDHRRRRVWDPPGLTLKGNRRGRPQAATKVLVKAVKLSLAKGWM